jgi:hypothetical protein
MPLPDNKSRDWVARGAIAGSIIGGLVGCGPWLALAGTPAISWSAAMVPAAVYGSIGVPIGLILGMSVGRLIAYCCESR